MSLLVWNMNTHCADCLPVLLTWSTANVIHSLSLHTWFYSHMRIKCFSCCFYVKQFWCGAWQLSQRKKFSPVQWNSAVPEKKWRLHVHSLYPPGMWPSRTSDGCRRRSHTMWTAISLVAEIKQGKMLASTHTTKPCTYTRSKSTPPPQFVYMFRFYNVLGAPPFFGTEIFLLLLWHGICTAGQHGSGSCAKEKPFFHSREAHALGKWHSKRRFDS